MIDTTRTIDHAKLVAIDMSKKNMTNLMTRTLHDANIDRATQLYQQLLGEEPRKMMTRAGHKHIRAFGQPRQMNLDMHVEITLNVMAATLQAIVTVTLHASVSSRVNMRKL